MNKILILMLTVVFIGCMVKGSSLINVTYVKDRPAYGIARSEVNEVDIKGMYRDMEAFCGDKEIGIEKIYEKREKVQNYSTYLEHWHTHIITVRYIHFFCY